MPRHDHEVPPSQPSEKACCHGGHADPDSHLADIRRRLIWGAGMTAPVLLLAMGNDLPWIKDLPHAASQWTQFVWCTPVVVWAGKPIWLKFWQSVRTQTPGMFTLIGLGVGIAWLFSTLVLLFPNLVPHEFQHRGSVPVYFEAAAAITVLVLLGQLLEARATAATGSAMKALIGLVPRIAFLAGDLEDKEVPLAEVKPGDALRIKPGAKVPVDGVVISGRSPVDESMLSGEATPQYKEKGARVTAGTLNGQGSFVMRAERVGADTLLQHIIRMVEEAQRTRAPVQRLADRVSMWFVHGVLLVSTLTFVLWWLFGPEPALAYAVVNAVCVLIIACPCALGLATPMALTVGIGRGAQRGILIRHAHALEVLEAADVLLLDKTGTLTEGRPTVTDVVPLPGCNERDILACAAAVEAVSEHPLAEAIVRAARARGVAIAPATEFQAIPGGGVLAMVGGQEVFVGQQAFLEKNGVKIQADFAEKSRRLQETGHTVVIVVLDEKPLGLLALADKIKDTTPAAVAALHGLGLKLCMLTGDNEITARHVAAQLHLDEVRAELAPQDKLKFVKEMQATEQVVAFAGDGINDAPALAAAHVGIAMGNGTEVAMESAGVILVKGNLHGILSAIELSRATMRVIRQNLGFAFLYNGFGIPLAAGLLYPWFGLLLSPMFASVAMSLSSLSVILNSLRLRRA